METYRRPIDFYLPSGMPEELGHWAKMIEKTANELCNDPECKKVQFKIDMNRMVLADIADYDSLECLYHSFKKHEKSIPSALQKIIKDPIYVITVKSGRRFAA